MTLTSPERLNKKWARRGHLVLRALACVPVALVYLFVLVLMRVVPYRPPLTQAPQNFSDEPPKASAFPIHLSVAIYRYSLAHSYMHRKGERCMFLPSCTEYAERVGNTHGLLEGLVIIGNRFRRCRSDTTEDFLDFP